jgi:hypothetical protein
MYKVLFGFLKVSAFRLASNSPSAILFPSNSLSHKKSLLHQKAKRKASKQRQKAPKQKPRAKAPRQKPGILLQ